MQTLVSDIADNITLLKFSGCAYNHTLKSANVCLKAYTAFMGNLILNVSSNSSVYVRDDIINVIVNVTNVGDKVGGVNVSLNLDENIEIISCNLTWGRFNDGLWVIDELESQAIMNLTLRMLAGHDINNIIGLKCLDYARGNLSSVNLNLKYLNSTRFIADNITVLSGSDDTATVTLVDMLERPISNQIVILNGNITLTTDENGSANISLNLTKGKYVYNIYFGGNDIYDSCSANFTVDVNKRPSRLVFNGTVMSYYPASLPVYLFGEDFPLTNRAVKFIFENQNLTLTTDNNGTVNLSGLKAGNYNVSAIFCGDDFYEDAECQFNVSIIKRNVEIISGDMVTTAVVVKVNGYNGQYFKATLKDENGYLISGKQVSFVINGKTYTRITNSKGVASLQINLAKSGKYSMKVMFCGDDRFNKITKSFKVTVNKKKMSLKVPKKTFKLSKVKKLTATLKDNKGKAISGKKITFTVNKKKYVAKTNKKGIATVKVNLSKKKTYTFKAQFAGDKSYGKITTKSKIIIK